MGTAMIVVMYCVMQSGVLDCLSRAAKRCVIRILSGWLK
jgi:hypothetical protein